MSVTMIINNSDDIALVGDISSNNNLTKFAVDLEGDDLCRHGKINYIQLYDILNDQIYIFNCSILTKTDIKTALGRLFESKTIAKYMFDCRSDVDALYHQYDIITDGVLDVQLYEIGYRKSIGGYHRFYHGFYKTLVSQKYQVGISDKQLAIKDKYHTQFRQNKFDLNLNEPDVLEYLKIDIIYLEKLFLIFNQKIGPGKTRENIDKETKSRQNIWMLPHFVNDRSNAISKI
jgi:hypothetical protein